MNILSRVVVCMASDCGLCVSSQAQTDIFSYIISESGKNVATSESGSREWLGALTEIATQPGAESTSGDEGVLGALGAVADPFGIGSSLSYVGEQGADGNSVVSPINSLNYVSLAFSAGGFYQNGFVGQPSAEFYSGVNRHPGFQGSLYTPEWGRITSEFGYRAKYGRLHKGIDIAMEQGDTVRSALAGYIERVGYERNGYGHYVVVRHDNGMETRYAHLTLSLVGKGDKVAAGQPIALSGNTGRSTGPHLHFETRYMGTALDPRTVFDFSSGFAKGYRNMVAEKAKEKQRVIATGFNGARMSLEDKKTYIVRPGDTVAEIAERAGITTLRLCQLNFITEETQLKSGTMLKLR